MPTVELSKLGSEVARISRGLIARSRPDQILVGQAKRRMAAGGESEHKYPELWEPKKAKSYRTGGQPLLDNGMLRNSLSGFSIETSEGVRSWLIGPLVAKYHQEGFSTEGPNYIPLTLKGRRDHTNGENPEDEGLVDGVDYIIAWNGVTVPQRKIFNLPPEDVEEIAESIRFALR